MRQVQLQSVTKKNDNIMNKRTARKKSPKIDFANVTLCKRTVRKKVSETDS